MLDFAGAGQTLGAIYQGGKRTRFRVWAPEAQQMEVRLVTPSEQLVPMTQVKGGYWEAELDDVDAGCLYVYRINGDKERPDPVSRFQPDGVHGPSMVVAEDFAWEDQGWVAPALSELIIYELHVGTFTPEGTFEAIIPYLPELRDLGITAIEIMPVAQFPGPRNWGYDGVGLFAVQNSYGGPDGLRRLVGAAHQEGLAVVLDVVYNHLGAEGNYLWDYGPYFTDRYKTPWGSAVNFDGPYSDDVRRYFMENAMYWLLDFHVDALRLDAVHAILDFSAGTFLEQLELAIEAAAASMGRKMYLIAESDLNDSRVVRAREIGGYGLDAQWMDDFHHAVHVLLTGETDGYYVDYALPGVRPDGRASPSYLVKALREGYVYSGQYSRFRKRRHGNSSADVPAYRFVVCNQNHDQIGNRMMGERLSVLVPFEKLKLAAGILLLSPFVPMLFMGEEYGETNPFQYFISHTDPALVEAVRTGRREEFSDFAWQGDAPDPAAEETFLRSKLCRQDAQTDGHKLLYNFYRELIRLRTTLPALRLLSKEHLEAQGFEAEQVVFMRRWAGDGQTSMPELENDQQIFAAFNFGDEVAQVKLPVPIGRWRKALDSGDERWQIAEEFLAGPGPSVRQTGRPTGGSNSRRSEAPAELDIQGDVTLTVAPAAFVLYAREAA